MIIWLMCGQILVFGQLNDQRKSVQIEATVTTEPATILLNWDDNIEAINTIEVHRRLAGETSWGTAIASLDPGTTEYLDEDVQINELYEYRVIRQHENGFGNGYIFSGIDMEPAESQGILILVIEDIILDALEAEVFQYVNDVEAEGWLVKPIEVNAADTDVAVKQSIQSVYDQNPEARHALFLLGEVPVPYSGRISPDGHNNHVGAWSADVFYGDMDGNWTDTFVTDTSAQREANHNVPDDGKWDNSTIASDLELEIGRVDFHNLSVFDEDAVELTRRYLNKNHAYRTKAFTPVQRGLIENNFNGFAEGFGQNGLKNFSTLVGRDSTQYLDYNTLKTESYIWSYGCGGGNYQGAGGIANSNAMSNDSFQTVFTFLFGSYFGDWDSPNNFLRSALGSGTILTSAWAGRPNWNVHPMAMGHTIGYCARLTQNNTGFSYDSGFGNRSIHVALMGDPTLRMYVTAAPTNVNVSESLAGNLVTWTAAEESDVMGYHVYFSTSASAPYTRLSDEMVTAQSFVHPCPPAATEYRYLVKTVTLETTPSGRFFNESIGTSAGIMPTIDRNVVADFNLDINETEVSFTSTSTNATQFSWTFGDGAASDEENPTHTYAPGDYEVQLIASNACRADTFSQMLIIMPSGVEDLDQLGVAIMPNPIVGGQLNLETRSPIGRVELSVLDLNGRVVARHSANFIDSWRIQLGSLASGPYTVLLTHEDGQAASKIIVLH